jgi:hypothetical protein
MAVNFRKTAAFLQEELQAFFRVLRLGNDVEASGVRPSDCVRQ